MKHPALARMLGVFLAVISLITAVAGGLGFQKADTDYAEQQRQERLLESRIAQAEELRAQLEAQKPSYDAAAAGYTGREEEHQRQYSGYRMDLATYTATRAGLSLGLEQLDGTAALLDESMTALLQGFWLFLDAEAQFQGIYDTYQSLLALLERAEEIYQTAAARAAEDPEAAELSFTPEEILALTELAREGSRQLGVLLEGMKEDMPDGQREVAGYVRQAVETYGQLQGDPGDVSVEALAYTVTKALYDEAQAAIDEGLDGGLSPEEAMAAADLICQQAFGLSFGELGQWLDAREPQEGGGDGGAALSPEMLAMVVEMIPGDSELIDLALGLLEDTDKDLAEKEAAFRADPHDMTAEELLLALCKEGLDTVQRLVGLVGPTLDGTKQQLKRTHAQLDNLWVTIHNAQLAVEEGYLGLIQKAYAQGHSLWQLRQSREELEAEKTELDALKAVIDDYEGLQNRYRSLRAQLLADDEIYARQQAGEDFLAAARAELALRQPANLQEHELRYGMCALMVASGLLGILSSLGAFEKPRMRHLWIPLLLAVLPAAVAEGVALYLERGLLYSALFVIIFGLVMLPLCRRQKGAQA